MPRGTYECHSSRLLILRLLSGLPLVMAAKTIAWEYSEAMHGQFSWIWLYWQLSNRNRTDHTLLFLIFRGLHLPLTLLQVSHVQDKLHESRRATAYQHLLAIPPDSMKAQDTKNRVTQGSNAASQHRLPGTALSNR